MSARPRLLVIGASGQVGSALRATLPALGEVVSAGRGGGLDRAADLEDLGGLARLVREVAPAVVLNAAAHTAVDQAEAEPARAHRLNALAPEALARACAEAGAVLVQYSTDHVFGAAGPGAPPRPWREDDPTGPVNAYGASKREGERRVLAGPSPCLVLRTSWVYARHGRNFLTTMERLFAERPEVRVVDDQHGAPTSAPALAQATREVLARLTPLGGPQEPGAVSGIYHAACAGRTTWFGFAAAIHARLGATCRLVAVPTAGYPTPARRPAWSVLDGARLLRVFGVRLPDWAVALDAVLPPDRSVGSIP